MAASVITTIPQNVTGGTLLWKMSSAFGAGDTKEIVRLTRLGVAVALGLSAALLPVIWMLRRPLVNLLNISGQFRQAAEWILPCVAGLMLLGGINESLGSVIRGCQNTGLSTVIQTVASVLNASCVIGALLLGSGLWSLLLGFAVAFVLTGVGFYVLASRVCPGITLKPKLPRASDLRSVRKYVGCLLVGTVSAGLRAETDKLVLSSLASPTWAGYYGLATRLAGLVMEASNFFYVPTIAAVGAMHARNDWLGIRALYAKLMVIVPLAAGAVVVVISGLPQHIMTLWIGRSVPEVITLLNILLCGYASAVILTGPGTCVCKAIGRIEVEAMYIAVCLALNVGLTIVLVARFGAMGTVIATAISWTVGSLYFIFIFDRRLDFNFRESLGALKCLLAIPPVVLVYRWWFPHMQFEGSRLFVFGALVVNSLSLLAVFFSVMIALGVVPYRVSKSAATQLITRFVVANSVTNGAERR